MPIDLIDDAQQIELMQSNPQFLGDFPLNRLLDRLQPIHLAAGKSPTPGFGFPESADKQKLSIVNDGGAAAEPGSTRCHVSFLSIHLVTFGG